jgi:hypothetical protein
VSEKIFVPHFPFRFPLSTRVFRADRLVVFAIASILIVPFTLLVAKFGDPSRMTAWKRIPLGLIFFVGPILILFLWLGMWLYWARVDASRVAVKRFWFVILLLGFWYGSAAYCLAVYLPQSRQAAKVFATAPSAIAQTSSPLRKALRLLLIWWIVIVSFVLASMTFPRVVLGIPHFARIRILLPLALVTSLLYVLWSLYRAGTNRSGSR